MVMLSEVVRYGGLGCLQGHIHIIYNHDSRQLLDDRSLPKYRCYVSLKLNHKGDDDDFQQTVLRYSGSADVELRITVPVELSHGGLIHSLLAIGLHQCA